MSKVLMKGNEAIGAAAIAAGCKYFFGYPITPQSELPEYLSRELPKVGGTFLQAESEIAAINMIYGAAGTGTRVMTSSSSPGISLKQEGITYIAGAELPCVIMNIMRGGPGLGSIQPSQTDYFQATRGGGNGDYRTIAFAPNSIQEMVDLIMEGFDIAEHYRNPVLICGDGMLGQMMEPVEFREVKSKYSDPDKSWAADGDRSNREKNVINSLYLSPEELEEHNKNLIAKYAEVEKNEVRVETDHLDDAELVFAAYGTTSRICKSVMETLREEGHKVGLIRPISIWPFPYKTFEDLPESCKDVLVVEMNTGQMVDDVKIGVAGKQDVHFYGRQGGMIPAEEDIADYCRELLNA